MTAAEIKKGFHRLSIEDRLRLLQELWDELAEDSSAVELSAEDQVELEKRYDEFRANPGTAKTWEQLRSELRSRH